MGQQRHIPAETLDILLGEVVLQLMTRLRQTRATPEKTTPITRLEGYVAIVTHHVLDAQLRDRSPEYARLRRRLRYIMSRSPDLELREYNGLLNLWIGGNADASSDIRHPGNTGTDR